MGILSWFGPKYGRDGSKPADTAIVNADVFTSDRLKPRARAVAVKDGEIVHVGDDETVSDFVGPHTRVINARGKMLTPGFVDNHCHILWVGALSALMSTALYECESLEEVLEKVVEHAEANPDLPLVMAMGWKYDYIPGGEPTSDLLDEVIGDRPVLLWSYDGHSGWANSPALEKMQKNPRSFLELAPAMDDEGKPTGMFHTFWFIEPFLFFKEEEFPPDIRERMMDGMSRALEDALRVGVTTTDDVMIHRSFFPVLLEFRDRGGFDGTRCRCTHYVNHHALSDEEELVRELGEWKGMARESTAHVVIGASIKLGTDGVPPNHTSPLFEPYSDRPGFRGEASWSQDDFDRVVEIIDGMGLQPCTHCCGDAAVNMALNSYEKALASDRDRPYRLRLDHYELPVAEDIERTARLGIHAAMQPTHFFGDETVEKALGPERLGRLMPWRSIEKAGIELSFGSDWCAGPINPIYGLLISSTRLNYHLKTDWGPGEKIGIENAIRHWTIDSAKALVMDELIGSIEVGKRADMVLFSQDLTRINSWWFMLTHNVDMGELDDFVLMTMVDGGIVYERKGWKR